MIIFIAVLAVVVGGGIWLGRLGNTKNPKVSPNQNDADCRASCSDLHNQHNDLCVAERNLSDAEAYGDRMKDAMFALGGGLIGVIGAAIGATALIETLTALLGTPVAIAIVIGAFIIGAALALLLMTALVAWLTAQVVASEKRYIASELRNLKADALSNVRNNCTGQEAQDCVASLVPCS